MMMCLKQSHEGVGELVHEEEVEVDLATEAVAVNLETETVVGKREGVM